MTSDAQPIDITFFGLPFSVPLLAIATFAVACAAFSFWNVFRSLKSGVHIWRSHRTIRADTPRLFAFEVAATGAIGFIALAGAVIITFGLGMKP